jgi:hypothetical protein
MGEHNSRNLHVRGADPQARTTEPLEDHRLGRIERQYRDAPVVGLRVAGWVDRSSGCASPSKNPSDQLRYCCLWSMSMPGILRYILRHDNED